MGHSFTQLKIQLITTLTVVAMILSCSSDKGYSFKTSEEALNACRLTLADLRNTKDTDIGTLTEKTSQWIFLQDTTYTFILNDSTVDDSSKIVQQYFDVCDSIRDQIISLVTSKNVP